MTLRKAIENFNHETAIWENWVDLESMGNDLGIYKYICEPEGLEKIKCCFLESWYCTDTYVGYRAYFFELEFIAFSFQLGRRYDQEFYWASEKIARKIKEYLISLDEDFSTSIETTEKILDKEFNGPYFNR